MSSLPWIRLSNDLPDHPKSDALAALLDCPRAWTHVVELWLWASRVKPDGNLEGLPDSVIAKRAGWAGDASAFVDALRAAGFMDDGGWLHGWDEHQGKALERLETDRKRKAEARAAGKTKASAGSPQDVQRTSDGSPQEIRETSAGNPSLRNETIRDETKEEPPTPKGAPSAGADLFGGVPKVDPQPQPNQRSRKRDRATVVEPTGDVGAVWAHYREHVAPKAACTTERADLIAKWLKPRGPYEVADLTRTIDGYRVSPHHNGQNETGTKYLALDLFLRDAKHIEAGWAFLAPAAPVPRPVNASAPRPPPVNILPPLPTRTPEADEQARLYGRKRPSGAISLPGEAEIAERRERLQQQAAALASEGVA